VGGWEKGKAKLGFVFGVEAVIRGGNVWTHLSPFRPSRDFLIMVGK
jgi:hypothetical protein